MIVVFYYLVANLTTTLMISYERIGSENNGFFLII